MQQKKGRIAVRKKGAKAAQVGEDSKKVDDEDDHNHDHADKTSRNEDAIEDNEDDNAKSQKHGEWKLE